MNSMDILKLVLCTLVFNMAMVSGNPLSSRLRRSISSTANQDGPYSTCSNTTSLERTMYYPQTTIIPVHAFDVSLLLPGDYDTQSSIPNRECPYNQAPTDYSLSESGLCPFDYYEDYQSDRIPARIMKARCRPSCTTCIDPFTNKQTSALQCKEVTYTMTVMKKVGCEGDVFKYEQYTEEFPVACVCQRTVRPQPPRRDDTGLPPL
ncbi:uncharacterized protein [Antedon mediterranea]|uniref:uncharacterized protein n=1 Tax=Antedon mediterranea TaxID=105859 RepID=UPI003AF73F0F